MIKGFLDKLFKSSHNPSQKETTGLTQAEIEALVDTKVKEHTASLQSQQRPQTNKTATPEDDYTLSEKQIEYALAIIHKISNEFELATNPKNLTIKDLNRLIAYQRYKNKGTLVNLMKKGVLKKK